MVRVAFDVDRVWKGSVPRQFILFVRQSVPEMPQSETKRRYVALATRMTDQARIEATLTAGKEVLFESVRCGEISYPFAEDSGLVR